MQSAQMGQGHGAAAGIAVLLMSPEPRLVREAFVVAERVRGQGYRASVLQVDPGVADADVVARVRLVGGCATALGVTEETLDRCIGASQALLRGAVGPVVMFGRLFSSELVRRKVPTDAVTGVVVGPAAPTVVDFLRTGLDGGRQAPVAGLDRLDGDYRPRSPRGAQVEGVALPTFEDADLLRLRREGLPVRLSYGCPRRCAFCGEQAREGRYRSRPADEVVQELLFHRRRNNVRRMRFCDLVVNGDLALLEAVCDLLLEHECVDLVWWGRALVDPAMPLSLYRKLRLAGCVGLEFEVISGSDEILAAMGAGFTVDDAGQALRRASAAGLDPRVSLIVGLPGEMETQFGDTCRFLQKHRYDIAQVVDLRPCILEEGSALLREHGRFGISLPREEPERCWHDGGCNTAAYREKRARELRVFVEDGLRLEVVGRAQEVGWGKELRAQIATRLRAAGEQAAVETGRFRRENLDLAGVVQQGPALAGPSYLEIDLTNNCNLHCAGCWVHSFLLGDDRLRGAKRRATLDYEALEPLIRTAHRLGARKIQLSGAGEPFMHPRIDDLLALIKGLGIEVNVITNFTLVDEVRARRLVDLGVDAITVSLWAGSPATYAQTHPTTREGTFEQIVRVISHLTWYRRHTGARFPRVKIYNVISNLNAHEINEMIDVARDMGADLIEFTPIDIVAGRTDSLALTDEDSRRIVDQLMQLRRRPDYLQRTEEEVTEGRLPGLDEQGEFARFVQRHRLPGDFRFDLADIRRWEAYCRRGIHCSRVYEEIHRDSVIFFGFPRCECGGCAAVVDCSVTPMTLTVRAPYLSLQGFGSFWRRVKGDAASGRDAKIVDAVPCAIGYTYARVQATGHVIPCCKAADFPLGNILERPFEEIWFSPAYDEFRTKALSLPKGDPYFKPMECYRVCDNLGHNMATAETLGGLSPGALQALLAKG